MESSLLGEVIGVLLLSLVNPNINSSVLSLRFWALSEEPSERNNKEPLLVVFFLFFSDESGPGWRGGGPLLLITLSRLWRYQSEKAEQQGSIA